jgi:hypothetical protein
MIMAVALNLSEAEKPTVSNQLLGHGPYSHILGATKFEDRLASEDDVAAFALRIGESTGLLGATLEEITLNSPGNTDPSAGCDKWGAVVSVGTEEVLRGDA